MSGVRGRRTLTAASEGALVILKAIAHMKDLCSRSVVVQSPTTTHSCVVTASSPPVCDSKFVRVFVK